ncbi:class I tRNA ligase family protein [Alicyclobacillus fastidiosus]|uniref:class I tRNA ligase family protein n=1 Tax=Alicyclobacillus fastidiosus TaxID=392011 RepID=UPI0035303934
MTEVEVQLKADCARVVLEYRNHLRHTEFRKAVQALRELWSLGNGHLDARAPWTLVHEDEEAAATVLRTAIHFIRLFAVAAHPVIPHSADKVFDALHVIHHPESVDWNDLLELNGLVDGHPFKLPEILFRRVEPADVEAYDRRFGGAPQARST